LYNYFRNGNDYTELYGGSKSEGSLLPYIYQQFVSKAKTLVLDGEVVVYNTKMLKFEPFGQLKKAVNGITLPI
jgi:DNA ligase-4